MTPIHIQRFAPADLHSDEYVQLLEKRRDYLTLTFYRCFIDYSFVGGGDLPADPETLAAIINMPQEDVEQALEFCLGRLVFRAGKRLYQRRVKREVEAELEYRRRQSETGKKGGRPRSAKGEPKREVLENQSPPAPTPAPSSAPYAGAEVEAPVNGGFDDQRPDVRAETAIRKARWAEERELLAAVQRISERIDRDPSAVMREVTAYKRGDGTIVAGKTNPALLRSAERVTKSLEDAKAWLAELEKS